MERPTGVTILAVLGFVSAGLLVLAAMLVLLGSGIIANLAARPGGGPVGGVGGALAGLGGALIGVFFLVLAAVYLVGGIGLWKLQNWARILVMVLCFLGAFFNAIGVLTALFHFHPLLVIWRAILLAVNLWIAFYLLKPHVKQAFGVAGS